MHKCNNIGFKQIVTALLIILYSLVTSAQKSEDLMQTVIKFSHTKLSVKQVLDELNQLPEINIVYGSNEDFLKLKISLPTKSMTVQKALKEIKHQAPVDIIFNNSHIIIKRRKLAESYLIKGTIRDAATNEELIAADIYLAETTKGTVSDLNGNFSLRLKPGKYQLLCRYIGYNEKQIPVQLYQNTDLKILLEIKKHEILEVNVSRSIGEIENIEKGRSIETIEAKTINQLNTNDVNDALHGRINGVWTTKVSGAPGDHHKIRIRGISSIFGSTDPLYVVDGMIIPVVNFKTLGIADLNTHDVNSITVLKDASSTALYGYLGGNGVVLIETKKGGGETQFNFNVKKGFQQFSKRYDLMESETFLNTLKMSDSLINTRFYKIAPTRGRYETYPVYRDSLGNTLGSEDFQEELFRTGDISEFQLSGQGNFKTIDFYLSGNYYSHNGIITNSKYNKYTVTGNFSKIVGDKFSIRLLYKGSHQENKNNLDNYMGNNVIFKGINYEPAYRTTPDSFFVKIDRLYYNDYTSASIQSLSDHEISPDKLFYSQEKKKTENSNSFNMLGYYRLNEVLSLRASLSLALRNIEYSSYIPSGAVNEKFLLSKENFVIFSQQYDLNYEKLKNNHGISAFIRYRNYKDNVYWNIDSTKNINLDGLTPEDDIYMRGSQAIYGETGSVLRSINSAILNFNYSYRSKYFISIIGNFDHLKEGHFINQGTLFSSVAINWDLSKEDFLHMPEWINAFNLSANWGQAGNYPLNSLSDDLYSTTSRYTANDTVVIAAYISNLANHHITHEKVTETNFGAEISLLHNRLILSGDYYIKKNTDLLIQRPIPIYYGGGFIYQNIGEMKNTGIEMSLEITPISRDRLYWTTRFGFSTNNQYITKLYDGEEINFNDPDILFPDFYARENEPLGSITGYSYQGKWVEPEPSDSEDETPRYVEHMGLAYLKVDSLNPQRLNKNDKTIIGNSIPDFTFNWFNIIEYRNFTCEMLWYGAIGADKYNATKASTFVTGTNVEVRSIVKDGMDYITDNVFYESSFFVEDASFIRLKTISLIYRQSKKIASKISMKYTISFENLITITRYSGYDPEATIYTNNNFTDNAIDKGSYPNPRGIYFSINMSF